ncbi:MAG: hypothetical protein JKY28_05300 [Sulfurimonas sp.]|nr:hypothetical protein [Sulfurimonas sp.]PHQ88493.1 MAG: hypothetical protein COB42_08710 [Sulfurimonas sp.]
MKTIITLSAIALLLVLSGCMSPIAYKKYGDGMTSRVGYSDFEIGKDKYKVSYMGGVHDSHHVVMKNAYRRAKEVCFEKGFENYEATNGSMSTKDSGSTSQYFGNVQFSDSKSQGLYMLDVQCR